MSAPPSAPGFPPSPPPPGSSQVPRVISVSQLVTGLAQCLLQGILITQLSTYLTSARVTRPARGVRENRWMISYVILVSILSLIQTSRYIYLAYYINILQKNLFALSSRWIEPLMNALLSDLVRLFFIYRTYMAIHSLFLLIPLCTIQALISSSHIWLVVTVHDHFDVRYITKQNTAFNAAVISSLMFDVLITTILCYGLFKSRTGIGYLDRFITRIMVSFWTCAIPPAFIMIPAVVLYNVDTNLTGSAWCAFCLAISAKFYAHSLLRSLNSRDRFSDKLQHAREAINDDNISNSLSHRYSNHTASTLFNDGVVSSRTRASVVRSIRKVQEEPHEVVEAPQDSSVEEPTYESRARLDSIISALEFPKMEEWRSDV